MATAPIDLRWAQDKAEEGADEDPGATNVANKKIKNGSAKAKTKQSNAKKQRASSGKKTNPPQATAAKKKKTPKADKHEPMEGCSYAAGDYSESRLRWIRKRCRKYEMTWRAASSAWNSSVTRANLLEGMSHAEKVRRRFV